MPMRCFMAVRVHLQRPPPTQILMYPSRRQENSSNTCPARGHESIRGVSSFGKKHRTSRAGDLDAGVHIVFQTFLRIQASRQRLIRGSQPPDFTCQAPNHVRHGTVVGLLAPTTMRWGRAPTGLRVHTPPGPPPLHRLLAPTDGKAMHKGFWSLERLWRLASES
jgi:hypothetical protein